MGIHSSAVRCLLYAKSIGADYKHTSTIGRQILYTTEIFLKENLSLSEEEAKSILEMDEGYAEKFFKILGAVTVDSFDNSDYENASYLHDFNQPIDDKYKNRYSTVFDGGSLEHVFNFPTALKNCMEMLTKGGHFIALAPANNWMGHGFYQFSPELYFSVFNEDNGFKINEVLLYESGINPTFYSVSNPESIGERTTLTNLSETNIFVVAQKISDTEVFSKIPMQSDYVSKWKAGMSSIDEAKEYTPPHGIRHESLKLIKKIGKSLTAHKGYDPKFFRPIDINRKL